MEFNLKVGIKNEKEIVVNEEVSAKNLGSGDILVYGTPAMISLMEGTCKDSIIKGLEDGYSTVGIEINVKHIKATPMTMKVRCVSELIEIKGKRLIFKVECFDEAGKIGEGIHTRYIINVEEFIKKANEYKK